MPIQFRCPACRQKLSISTRKSGASVPCPMCNATISVPVIPTGTGETGGEGAATTGKIADGARQRESSKPLETELPGETPTHRSAEPAAAKVPEGRPSAGGATHQHVLPEAVDNGGFSVRRKKRVSEGMDLTPMVDVTFQLLIFFMITASFSIQKVVQVPKPDDQKKGAMQSLQMLEELERDSIMVEIDERNGITIDDERIPDTSALTDRFQSKMRLEQKRELVLTTSNNANHRTFIAVVDAANEAGIQKIRLASRSGSAN